MSAFVTLVLTCTIMVRWPVLLPLLLPAVDCVGLLNSMNVPCFLCVK